MPALSNEEVTALFKRVQDRMKRKSKPVPVWDTASRGSATDPQSTMNTLIKPNFPDKIQARLNSLEEDLKSEMKQLFDHCVPGIENCGNLVFTCKDVEDLCTAFEEILKVEEQQKFTDMFFDLNIVAFPPKEKSNGKKASNGNIEGVLFTEFFDMRKTSDFHKARLFLFGKETKPIRSTRTLLDFRFQNAANMKPRCFIFGKSLYDYVEEPVKEPMTRKRSRRS